jgi:hypothetical protein
VVVALLDGTRAGGFLYNFSPNATELLLFPKESDDRSHARLLGTAEIKAVFFVKTHEGNRVHREAMRKGPEEPDRKRHRGHRMKVTFADGEVLEGTAEVYNPVRIGFFVYPVDPRSNNLRIFIINANVRAVDAGPGAKGTATSARGATRPAAPPVDAPRVLPSAPALAAPPPARGECAIPAERRVEAVLRIIAGDSALDVSEEMGVPAGVLGHWAQVFLLHGRDGLTGEPGTREKVIRELAGRVLELEEELARVREKRR